MLLGSNAIKPINTTPQFESGRKSYGDLPRRPKNQARRLHAPTYRVLVVGALPSEIALRLSLREVLSTKWEAKFTSDFPFLLGPTARRSGNVSVTSKCRWESDNAWPPRRLRIVSIYEFVAQPIIDLVPNRKVGCPPESGNISPNNGIRRSGAPGGKVPCAPHYSCIWNR